MSDWWLESVFYQVYLPSFQDSDGNGIGDLRGVINRLDYFQDLGIDAIWITPFYESPKVDNGYDISNHKAIDPEFGSMEDFEE
ncbi:MAG: alpha-amylase family glycosyl hydrolase [Xenococcaceae cyanobacterium MO_188.B29]|nr:alpha-amylase family glycosyl hydrolase [Xenococcaceae cyanobacterium MO_188.B29]